MLKPQMDYDEEYLDMNNTEYQGTYNPGSEDFGLTTPKQNRKEKRNQRKEQRKAEKERKRLEKQNQKTTNKTQQNKRGFFSRKEENKLRDFTGFDIPNNTPQNPDINPSQQQNENSMSFAGNLSEQLRSHTDQQYQQAWEDYETEVKKRRESLFKRKKKPHKTKQDHPFTHNQQLAMRQMYGIDQQDGYDPGRMIEREETEYPVPFGVVVGVCVAIAVIGCGLFGYFETDFDEVGQPHFVNIDKRYERRYVKKSDELLQKMIDATSYIENDTADMSDYVTKSTEIKAQNKALASLTDKMSKYVGVPESMQAYHEKLLNVALGIQNLQRDILSNSQNSDYLDWRRYSIAELDADMESLHNMRTQVDLRIWTLDN